MANRRFTSQFNYSFERMPVSLMGSFAQTDVGAFATLVSSGVTYTADVMGSAGNSITIALVTGGTAGAEVVTVSGLHISVSMEPGVSTQTQIKTALDNSVPAAALIHVSVASGGTAVPALAQTSLASGDDSDFNDTALSMTLTQVDTGIYQLQLQDKYPVLLSIQLELQRSSGIANLMPQVISEDVDDSRIILIRMISISGQALANMANGDVLYVRCDLRNSGVSGS